jgi:stage III sporulation protein AG
MKSQEKKWKFSLKKWDKQQWMILLLLGLILLVMAIPTKKISQTVSQKKTGSKNTMAGSGIYENLYGNSNADAQVLTEKAVLEQQLEQLLQQVEGIGQVKVMLMLENSEDTMTAFSAQNPSVSIQGVLIAAQGGDNSVVVRNIQEAVMALFQVEAHKIKVMKMK